jgi:putative hydrolase of the HAD superfamily
VKQRRGLILDFGGVLTTSVADCARGFDRREGLPEGTFLGVITKNPVGRALYENLERGTLRQSEWNARTGELLGVDGAGLMARVLTDLRPEPAVIGAARAARAQGVRVGVLCNSLGTGPYDVYDGYDLDERYDTVVHSEQHRMRKPDADLYRIMLDAMELLGEECVFVDDTSHNLPPARALGLETVHAREPATTVAAIEAALGISLRGDQE